MIAGNQMVHIDEDELLEELEALKQQQPEDAESSVVADGVIEVDGEIIQLPSVPKTEIKITSPVREVSPEREDQNDRRLVLE